MSQGRRFDSLTSLRGIAALAIVLFHAALAFTPSGALVHMTRTMPVAVSFFFVLSGLVLTWSWRDGLLSTFWRDRAARILPVYLLSWMLAVAGLSWLRWTPTSGEMLGSLLLLQSWVPGQHTAIAVNVPAWSLSCEVAFYAALPFVAPRILRAPASELRRWGFLTAAWIGVGTAAALVLPLEWWPGVRAPEFLTGVLLASWMRRGWRPGRITKTVGTVSCLLLVGLTLSPVSIAQPVLPLLAAPGCVALISVVAVIDLSDRRTILHSTALRKLGDWSYPLYLTHWIVVVLLSRFLLGAAWIPVAMLISVALAAAIHTCLERPAQLRLRTPSNSSQRPLANRPPIVPAEGARS